MFDFVSLLRLLPKAQQQKMWQYNKTEQHRIEAHVNVHSMQFVCGVFYILLHRDPTYLNFVPSQHTVRVLE